MRPGQLSLLILTLLLLIGGPVAPGYGQEAEGEEDHIETDRDSFTRSPRLVAPGRVVSEGSYTFLDQEAEYDGHLYPDLLIRFGISEWLELRVGWTYEVGKGAQLAADDAEKVEEGVITYGAKVYLTQADDWMPDSSLIVTGYTPTSGDSNDSDVSMEYALGWRFDGGWELDGGLRWIALAEEEDRFQEWAPSVVLKKSIGPCGQLNAHVEYFSAFSLDREDNYTLHYFGPGVHYLITPNLEIGTRVFWGMTDDSANFICNSGLGVRF